VANYQTQFSCRLAVGAGNVEAALALYAQMQAELGDIDIGFEAERNGPEDDALWLCDGDGAGDVEDVIAFALRCGTAFNLTGLWGFCWSLSCDRPRLDSNGGGAQVLDLGQRESLGWIDCQHWLAMRLGTDEPRAVLAETALHPIAAAQGWTPTTQVSVLLGFIDSLITADPAVADQLRSYLAAISGEQDGMLCRECGEPVFIANSGTSHHVGRGLDGIDYDRDRDHTAVADTGLLASGTLQEHAP